MVSKKVIEKLSDIELKNYLKPENRFVSKSVQYAFEILKERGTLFSEIELERIEQLIISKEKIENEEQKIINSSNKWEGSLTEDESAIELYSNRLIWVFSVIFGVVFGTALQVYNSFKVSDRKAGVISLIFGFSFTILQIYILNQLGEWEYGKSSLRFLISGIGALGLYFIRENLFKKNIEYRAKSFAVPLLITLSIHLVIIYFTFFQS